MHQSDFHTICITTAALLPVCLHTLDDMSLRTATGKRFTPHSLTTTARIAANFTPQPALLPPSPARAIAAHRLPDEAQP
jgi:hypothetical protein